MGAQYKKFPMRIVSWMAIIGIHDNCHIDPNESWIPASFVDYYLIFLTTRSWITSIAVYLGLHSWRRAKWLIE